VIPTLLWQCPLCHVDDALRHQTRWFKPDQVWCIRCGTAWEVQRVIGSDYRLRVIKGQPAIIGWEKPLAEWYDLMKANLMLVDRDNPTLQLNAEEKLYVQSSQARLFLEEGSPLFNQWESTDAPSQKQGALGFALMKKWDTGQLSLTSERLIWSSEKGSLNLWLRRINSVHTEVTWYLGLLYGQCRYKIRFRDDSVLKWLTLIALAAERIEQVYNHKISLSNY
jgi:hypothetical protein